MLVPSYPTTRRDDTLEILHGRPIGDPYRWLEDPDSTETGDWVRRQNEFSEQALSQLPGRAWFAETMQAVISRPRAGVPFSRGDRYFVTRNDGTQNQDVTYVAASLSELLAGGRVLIDPNTLAADGTTALTSLTVSGDGRLAAYGLSDAGSDWETFHLVELESGHPIDDAAIRTKFSTAEWLPDGTSYLYTHFEPGSVAEGTETTALGGGRLKIHRIGDDQLDDELILEFPENDQLFIAAEVTEDDHWVAVTIIEGTEHRNRLWLYPIVDDSGRSRLGEPIKIIDEPIASFVTVHVDGTTVFVRTDLDAARSRLVRLDLDQLHLTGSVDWKEVVPESEHTLVEVVAVGDGFIVMHLIDAQPRLTRIGPDGTVRGPIDVSGGALIGLNAHAHHDEAFIGFSSVTSPTQSFRLDAGTGDIVALPELITAAASDFTPPEIRIERRRATSADGTAVPYFLIMPADADLSRSLPTLLWGYGGFNIPIFADYRPGWSGWLAAGGLLAIANLRGGGEFGTEWYEAGRLDRKQNVFDDFIAVAEHLSDSGVTSPRQLAVHGRSNGGLLVGAVMTQRPELFAAAIPAVGVLDLLRFHKFTVGAAWMSDYGNPDDADQFEIALAYSPLHHLAIGQEYPATLVLTGDHDDRVVPLHSLKFTAALQHAQAGDRPVLARIEVSTGHGVGKPSALVAAEWADLLAFAAQHTGLDVPTTRTVGGAR